MRHMHRGQREETRDYARNPIILDHNFAMAEFVGQASGLQEEELAELAPRLEDLDRQIKAWRDGGHIGFFALPYDQEAITEIKKLARHLKEWCRDVLVLAVGESALGIKALLQALCHPSHNLFPIGRRQYHSRLFVSDNIESDSFYGLLDDLELKRLLVNVISESVAAPETLAKFLFVYDLLKGRLGETKAKESFLFTTGPQKGDLRRLAEIAGFPSFDIPGTVGDRFSVFSAAGLFPAAMAGIDIGGLLAGARFIDQRLQSASISQNLAYRLAACYYLAFKKKGCAIHVIMPYTDSLAGMADWFCRVWAAGLGKVNEMTEAAGPTPLRAVGTSDQQYVLPQVLQGPPDKFVTFLEVEKFNHSIFIPSDYPEIDSLGYLGGQSFAELLTAEKRAATFNLMKVGRPNLTIKLPEINAFTIGQLMYLWQITVVSLAGLLHVNPFDELEEGSIQQTGYGLMGRPGFEAPKQEFDQTLPLQDKNIL